MTSLKIWSETTPRRYISGIVALNLPTSPDSGDWHTVEMLSALKRGAPIPLRLAGENTEFNGFGYFGSDGVIEASEVIKHLGETVQGPVHVATHPRAIADMLMFRLPGGLYRSGPPRPGCLAPRERKSERRTLALGSSQGAF
jgi:hypothetical protein